MYLTTLVSIVEIAVTLFALYLAIKYIINKFRNKINTHSLSYIKYKYLDDKYVLYYNRLEDERLFFYDNPIETEIANILLKNRAFYNGKCYYTIFKKEMSEENFLKALHVLEDKINKYYENNQEKYNQVATLIKHEYEAIK